MTSNIFHNHEAERAVLGTMMLKPDQVAAIINELDDDDFSSLENRKLFTGAKELFLNGDTIDGVSLMSKCPDVNPAYIAQLTGGAFIPGKTHAQIIRDLSRKRTFLSQIDETKQSLQKGCDLDEVIQSFSTSFIHSSHGKSRLEPVGDIIEASIEKVLKRTDGPLKMAGIPSGYPDLDSLISGLVPGNLIILAARPSMGKTTFALNAGENVSKRGKNVAFFSMEMSRDELVQKMLSRASSIPLENIRSGRLDKEEREAIQKAGRLLKTQNLFIMDQPGLSVSQLTAQAKHISLRHGLDLLLVDYIQLMRGTGQNREQEVSSISRGLKHLAMDLKIPVIALSQLNRAVEHRTDKRPTMADLRDSGAIEQDANIIIFLYREEVYTPGNPQGGKTELNIAKNRSGRTGTVKLRSRLEVSEFASATTRY